MKPPTLSPTPDQLVDPDGQVRLGIFQQPLRAINLDTARIGAGLSQKFGRFTQFRLKEWQHYWFANEAFFFGVAVVDAKYLKVSFAYFVDRKQGLFFEQSSKGPFKQTRLPQTLWDDVGYFRSRNHAVEIHNHLDQSRHEITLNIAEQRQTPAFTLEAVLEQDLSTRQPLVVSIPLGENRTMYSHKAIVPAKGKLIVGDRQVDFDEKDTRCIIDIHKAHYPYRTWWRWATFWGWATDGREIGLNLTENVAEKGSGLQECAFWLDGKLILLGPAAISHRPNATLEPWEVATQDGAIRLTFHPAGERAERINGGLFSSHFHQPYGTYTGEAQLPNGETIEIDRAWGVAEDHVCRW